MNIIDLSNLSNLLSNLDSGATCQFVSYTGKHIKVSKRICRFICFGKVTKQKSALRSV